jgi:hypothetical protein
MPVLGSIDARAVEQEFEQLSYGTLHKTCAGRAGTLIGRPETEMGSRQAGRPKLSDSRREGKRWIAEVSWSGAGAPVCQFP